MKTEDALLLAGIGAGAYLIYKSKIGDTIAGVGTGISDASQGVGSGIANASYGLGSGISDIGLASGLLAQSIGKSGSEIIVLPGNIAGIGNESLTGLRNDIKNYFDARDREYQQENEVDNMAFDKSKEEQADAIANASIVQTQEQTNRSNIKETERTTRTGLLQSNITQNVERFTKVDDILINLFKKATAKIQSVTTKNQSVIMPISRTTNLDFGVSSLKSTSSNIPIKTGTTSTGTTSKTTALKSTVSTVPASESYKSKIGKRVQFTPEEFKAYQKSQLKR